MAAQTDSLSDAVTQVDMSHYLHNGDDQLACDAMALSMKTFGAVLIKDPRVVASDSDAFLDMMERYFSQPREKKLPDARPHLFYQVGVTPDGVERPRDNSALAAHLEPSERPTSDSAARATDPKWRFFWRCGARPTQTDFLELNASPVVPVGFESAWASTMDMWGEKLVSALFCTCEMLALGLGLPRDAFREKMQYGPHLLAPTGADMLKHGNNIGTTLAGYHYDLNLLTIHGRSRFPGLFVWTNTGKRVAVSVPPGYLLVQAGIQLEWLTAGVVKKGMHEVVVTDKTQLALKQALQNKKIPWRVSSTLFGHVRSDASIAPLGRFAQTEQAAQYPDMKAGEQVAEELRALELAT